MGLIENVCSSLTWRASLSRRTFLKTGTANAQQAMLPRECLCLRRPPEDNRGSVAANPPLSQFAYSDVELLDGPMKRQFTARLALAPLAWLLCSLAIGRWESAVSVDPDY
jgi:hypothetical protein